MKKVTISKFEFDTFVFQQVAGSTAENDNEAETAIRLMRKLKDETLTIECEPTKEEGEARKKGRSVFLMRQLREGSATFVLQDDEHKLLFKRLEKNVPHVALLLLEEFSDLVRRVKEAPAYDVPKEAKA